MEVARKFNARAAVLLLCEVVWVDPDPMCSTGQQQQQQYGVAFFWSLVLGANKVECISACDWSLLSTAEDPMGWPAVIGPRWTDLHQCLLLKHARTCCKTPRSIRVGLGVCLVQLANYSTGAVTG